MSRMSARFFAQKVGMTTDWVYEMWKKMGLVVKDNWGDWALTELGKQKGGKMSSGSRLSVPTFVFETTVQEMIDYYNKSRE